VGGVDGGFLKKFLFGPGIEGCIIHLGKLFAHKHTERLDKNNFNKNEHECQPRNK